MSGRPKIQALDGPGKKTSADKLFEALKKEEPSFDAWSEAGSLLSAVLQAFCLHTEEENEAIALYYNTMARGFSDDLKLLQTSLDEYRNPGNHEPKHLLFVMRR